jgi:hypothetical protein
MSVLELFVVADSHGESISSCPFPEPRVDSHCRGLGICREMRVFIMMTGLVVDRSRYQSLRIVKMEHRFGGLSVRKRKMQI